MQNPLDNPFTTLTYPDLRNVSLLPLSGSETAIHHNSHASTSANASAGAYPINNAIVSGNGGGNIVGDIHGQSGTTSAGGGRPPRSRKNRPCDRCRKAKSRCSIGPGGPPCTQCSETKRQCTFNAAPPPRKSVKKEETGNENGYADDDNYDDYAATPEEQSGGGGGGAIHRRISPLVSPKQRKRLREEEGEDASSGRSASVSGLDVLAAAVPSFDHMATSEHEPYVLTNPLTDDLLPIVLESNSHGSSPKDPDRAQVKQISSDPSRPVFVVLNPKAQAPSPVTSALHSIRTLLVHHPTKIKESTLIDTYHTHVHPALPILSDTPTSSLPPHLLAAILATALSHSKETRPLAAVVGGLLKGSSGSDSESGLVGVAATVLELGMRPMNSSRPAYLMLARTIALAQLLGMHLSPLQWTIPDWEKELRIRLWWTLAIHDAWMSFLNSRPCHIQANNSTVPLPTLSSTLVASCAYSSVSTDCAKSFIASCRLSKLVVRLQVSVSTLGAVSNKSVATRRQEVASLGTSADSLAAEWSEWIEGKKLRATGVTSFLLHLLGFRCMLKRLWIELNYGLGGTFEPGPEMLAPFNAFVVFMGRLTTDELDGYYLSYSSHILSSVVSSLIRLTLASPPQPPPPSLELVTTLINTLRGFNSNLGWDIALPALRRASAVAARLMSLEEHPELVTALKGGLGASTVTPGTTDFSPVNLMGGAGVGAPTVVGEGGRETQLVWDWGGLDWGIDQLLNPNT